MDLKKIKVGVLGAGSWGGTLAYIIGKKKLDVLVWTCNPVEFNELQNKRTLFRPKKLKLPKTINITNNLNDIVRTCNVIIIAVPTKYFKETIQKLKELNINKNVILLSATKGIAEGGKVTPSKAIKEILPHNKFGILSGPNIALDVIEENPIITVIATSNKKAGKLLQKIISTEHFRVYLNDDVNGVEIAGALKNVIAIASGICDGFGFSISTKASLISRGLVEIARIGLKEKAKLKTFYSAAGIGDLIATCCSPNSRNYKVGYAIGKGKNLKAILNELGEVAEGVETVKAMYKITKKYKIKAPITKAMYEIVVNNSSPAKELKELLKRPLPGNELLF